MLKQFLIDNQIYFTVFTPIVGIALVVSQIRINQTQNRISTGLVKASQRRSLVLNVRDNDSLTLSNTGNMDLSVELLIIDGTKTSPTHDMPISLPVSEITRISLPTLSTFTDGVHKLSARVTDSVGERFEFSGEFETENHEMTVCRSFATLPIREEKLG
jgi:hypothetical protein